MVLRTYPAYSISEGNPGRGQAFSVTSNDEGGQSTRQDMELTTLLQSVLAEESVQSHLQQGWLYLSDGLALYPQLSNLNLEGHCRTSTTIEVASPLFQGLFEYQHSVSRESLEDALRQGFRQWAQVDLPVLRDALRSEPQDCGTLQLEFPEHGQVRVVLGSVAHFTTESAQDGEHGFCPCCFFTNTLGAFKPLFSQGQVQMIRFYAARDQNGQPMADCRINGEDFAPGHQALLEYIQSWPERGLEFRKQLVLVQQPPQGVQQVGTERRH